MPRPRKYPEELLERGARLVFESGRPIAQVAADLGVHREALRKRVRQAEADAGGAARTVARQLNILTGGRCDMSLVDSSRGLGATRRTPEPIDAVE